MVECFSFAAPLVDHYTDLGVVVAAFYFGFVYPFGEFHGGVVFAFGDYAHSANIEAVDVASVFSAGGGSAAYGVAELVL